MYKSHHCVEFGNTIKLRGVPKSSIYQTFARKRLCGRGNDLGYGKNDRDLFLK